MLKTVSSITNAIGALNYKGTWNASANTPTLASGAGTKGDYYVVSVAGSTALDGISNWGVGDWVAFSGTAWQRVEGGADLNGVNLSVSGTSTLSALTASTALALDASKNIVSVTNTGTGSNVLDTAPTLVGNVTLSTGNLIIGTSGRGIDFSATPGTGTSELLADYEEGVWTPVVRGSGTAGTYEIDSGASYSVYTKIGRLVTVHSQIVLAGAITGGGTDNLQITGLPFAKAGNSQAAGAVYLSGVDFSDTARYVLPLFTTGGAGSTTLNLQQNFDNAGGSQVQISGLSAGDVIITTITYIA
jgi:hypothetical protein